MKNYSCHFGMVLGKEATLVPSSMNLSKTELLSK